MKIVENSVLEFFNEKKQRFRVVRVLWISLDKSQLVLFDLNKENSLPEWAEMKAITESIVGKNARVLENVIPFYQRTLRNR